MEGLQLACTGLLSSHAFGNLNIYFLVRSLGNKIDFCISDLANVDTVIPSHQFQKDNVFNAYLLKNDEFVKDGKSTDYSMNNGILTLGYGKTKDVLTIKRLTSNELVLYEYDNDSNYEDSFTITMKRIK